MVEFYRGAGTELQHSLMAGRIMEARAEIMARAAKLRNMPGLHREEQVPSMMVRVVFECGARGRSACSRGTAQARRRYVAQVAIGSFRNYSRIR